MCESCRFKHNERRKKSYQKMKREGICTVCASKKAVPGFLECQACSLRRQAIRAEAKRSKGVLCGTCKTQLVHDGTGYYFTHNHTQLNHNFGRTQNRKMGELANSVSQKRYQVHNTVY
ncbi:uncharacterized protein NECHADRAFT_86660 [Fusarium vanettenii 77-13-4]|uniref:Uncharacterized protein n=1 Tax=Fusarium vanettenii (strain ATCC MYA-4622 / CBS 123669 / FGSC 9596 / NRRL 45880 / 77-13-4) TaxID=660122 RepID=C7ZFS6_FUSV7|nr:uncharacterized protein NECHADRAFT_86660 [Fusarium vanettenii 77-13-4]EEU36998.1 predicted protein [Fusarium vanettenii 77-13-4]